MKIVEINEKGENNVPEIMIEEHIDYSDIRNREIVAVTDLEREE